MKTRNKILIIVTIVILIPLMWLYCYNNRKNCDNLPSLTSISQMEEAEINSFLPGYTAQQLINVWNEPDEKSPNEDIWYIGNRRLIVNYNNAGKVVICGLK